MAKSSVSCSKNKVASRWESCCPGGRGRYEGVLVVTFGGRKCNGADARVGVQLFFGDGRYCLNEIEMWF